MNTPTAIREVRQHRFNITSNNNRFPYQHVKKISYNSEHIILTVYEIYSNEFNDTYVDMWYKKASLEDHILLNIIDEEGEELYSEKFIGLSEIKEDYVNFDYSNSNLVERVFKIKYSTRIRELKR